MKKLFFIAVLTAASYVGSAQDFRFGGGINLGIPISNMEGSSIAAGVDLLGLVGLSETFGITVDAGYTSIFNKHDVDATGLIPIRAGIRFNATPDLYVGGKAGVGIMTGGGNSTTTTAYSFGAGYMMDPKLDIGVSYDGYSKNGSIGLINIRLGYFFN